MPPFLIKGRYGEPILTRIHNNTPVDRAQNGGFGRNETQLHFHNAHNGAESDGATGAHHFPGTFYDYRWSTTLARRDKINTNGNDNKAAGPDNGTGIVKVPGDLRELQGTMWAHDHRFFFTAENVYKGNLGMVNYYSGRDRGHETITSGTNLRLPSGTRLGWGNVDFDVNLVISDGATDRDGQLFFDIFTTDGFLGDLPLVNFAYAPYFEVLPRKYRFRILNACMSRLLQAGAQLQRRAGAVQVHRQRRQLRRQSRSPLTELDEQGIAERYDIVVDFSIFPVGSRDVARQPAQDARRRARRARRRCRWTQALAGRPDDPVVGKMMEFRVVSSVPSVDAPGDDPDHGQQLRLQRQEPGAGRADRADPHRRARAHQDRRVRAGRATATRATPSPASARPTARRSGGVPVDRSRSTARRRTPSTPTASRC